MKFDKKNIENLVSAYHRTIHKEGFADFDNTYALYPVGFYEDERGRGLLYYDVLFDHFYKNVGDDLIQVQNGEGLLEKLLFKNE